MKPELHCLSIIIVNWNTSQLLAECLASLQQNINAATDFEVETIVVDNASSDDSVTMVKRDFSWVKLICNAENRGFAVANNQAIQQASGAAILLLNSDTHVHMGALQEMFVFMRQNPRIGALGARLLNADGSLQPSCQPMLTPGREFWRLSFLDQLMPRATYNMYTWDTAVPRQVEVIKGACLLLHRQALDEIGLLDDRYFMYTEEVDLCYRLAQAGWQLWYLPTAVVTHYGERSSRQEAETMYVQLYRSKVQFYRKFGGERRARTFKELICVAYVPRWIMAHLQALFFAQWKPRARLYRRLLAELPGM